MSRAAEVTTIEITGKPLVKDVSRLGINLGSGSVHAMSRIKCMNFEGMRYRQCHIGDLHEDSFKPDAGAFPVNEHDYWRMNVEVVQGDIPPGSFGVSALLMKGSADGKEKPAHFRIQGQSPKIVEVGAKWHLCFWAKVKAGSPNVSVELVGTTHEVTVGKDWTKHEVTTVVQKGGQGGWSGVWVSGGDILLDDLTCWKDEEPGNPTVFSDECISVLRRLRPGTIRTLQMGGSSMERMLRPPLQTYAAQGRLSDVKPGASGRQGSVRRFSMHDYYTLAEHLGTEPWLCLPGTLQLDEIDQFMEFISSTAWEKSRKTFWTQTRRRSGGFWVRVSTMHAAAGIARKRRPRWVRSCPSTRSITTSRQVMRQTRPRTRSLPPSEPA